MKISLDHITIRTHLLEATRDFFIEVFGLKVGSRPKQIQRVPGYWLYADSDSIVHLIGSRGNARGFPAEALDHIGIRAEGYEDFLKKIQKMGIAYSLMDLPEIEERRIFFRAPGGQLIEAVFMKKINEITEKD